MAYNVYLARYQNAPGNGAIYKLTDGVGVFTNIWDSPRNFYGVTTTPTGNVYVSITGGDIYKQTNGVGAFAALNQTVRDWENLSASPTNGDVFANVGGALYLYKQTGGVGDFVQYEDSYNSYWRGWNSVVVSPMGDIYASQNYGDIFKQTGGTGDFVSQNAQALTWRCMAAAPNGDIYAATLSHRIFKQSGGVGGFEEITAPGVGTSMFYGMAVSADGDVYVTDGNQGAVHKLPGGSGDWEECAGEAGGSGLWRGMGITIPPLYPTRSYGTIIG